MKKILMLIIIISGVIYSPELYDMFPVFWEYIGYMMFIIIGLLFFIMYALFIMASFSRR